MTPDDLGRRIEHIERELEEIKLQLIVLTTAVALARWLGPFIVSIAAIAIVLLKG